MSGEKHVRRPWVIILVFAAMIAYIIAVLITSFTGKKDIGIYKVTKGSVAESLVVSGIILRDEEVFNASESGNIEYYQSSGSKVKVGDIIYSLDRTGEATEKIREYTGNGEGFSEDERFQIHSLLSSYRSKYEATGFESLYDTKAGMNSVVLNSLKDLITGNKKEAEQTGENVSATEEEKLSIAGDRLQLFSTDKAGYIMFSSDGYESLSAEDITSDMFDPDRYPGTAKGVKRKIESGECAYKLITGDGWHIISKLTPETVSAYDLKGVKAVTVNLNKAGTASRANFEIIDKDGELYGLISLNKYVMNYAGDRYAEFEISTGEDEGLQVPNSAVVTSEYYKIPRAYLTSGNNSKSEGFIIQNGDGAVFTEVEAEFNSSEDVFVKPDKLQAGSVLIMPDSDERFTVSETSDVKGVFLVNSGYTVFRAVEIISGNNEYSVLNEATSGVKLYDRVLLNAEGYKEGDYIY